MSPRQTIATARNYRVIRDNGIVLKADENAIQAIHTAVVEGIKAFPSRGLEVAGLLTGSLDEELRLDGVRPLTTAYRQSPAFRPSLPDITAFRQIVAQAQAETANPVGCFRSQTDGQMETGEVDEKLADLVGIPEPLLLLVPASGAGVGPARLFRRTKGNWKLLLQFALREDAPLRNSARLPVRSLGTRPLAEAGVEPAENGRSSPMLWVAAGLATVTLALAVGYPRFHSKAEAKASAPVHREINLSAQPSGQAIRVHWDSGSTPVLDGFSGILTVQDGARRVMIPLTREQLLDGNTVYAPESPWAELRLEIYRDGAHYTGEVVALATGISPPSRPQAKANGSVTESSITEPPAARPRRRRSILLDDR